MSAAVVEVKPQSRPYGPRGAAEKLFYCQDKEILIEGPAGTGKSRAVLEKVNLCLMKYPGSRALIVRKTRASMTESVLVTLEEKVLPSGSPLVDGASRPQRKSYEYPNGASLVVGGMDNSDRIMSTEYDLVAAFEATELTEADWEKLTTRLRNGVMPYQQGICDCNPGAPSHWLNRRANQQKMTRLLSRHQDNPAMFAEGQWTKAGQAYLSRLEALSGARLARLFKGKWAASEGMVYAEFDAAVHVKESGFVIPAAWRRIRSIDFGFTNPFVCQWWAIDPDGRMYLYREIYRSKRIVEDHVNGVRDGDGNLLSPGIQLLSGEEGFEATVSDHDAEDRATLDRHGIDTVPAYKAITPGIEAVKSRLRIAGDDKPRLYVLADCLVETDEELADNHKPQSTLQEFDGYIYPPGKDGKETKEDPVDVDNHGMDAMRYAVAYVDDLATREFEIDGGGFSS